MTYIKLLTVLTALALLTACGGAAAPANTGGDTTTDCKANPFAADCLTNNAPALVLRQNMCLADDAIHSTCDEVIVGVCMANPFQTTACLPDDTYLPNRIAECIKGGMGDTPNCRLITTDATKNTALTSCLTNPFAEVCETSVPDFTSSFEQARMNRASFCDNSDNATDDFCTGDNVGRVCGFDPFTAICPDATYAMPRQEACLADATTNPACTGEMGIATVFCKANLFSTETACMADTYDDDRQTMCLANIMIDPSCVGETGIATVFCKADPFNTSAGCTEHPEILDFQVINCLNSGTNSSCAELILVNHDDYLASFGDTPPLATAALAVADTAILSHFVSIGVDGIDREGLTGTITPLTLSRAGDAMDGVTYVSGIIEGVTQSFVGLLPSTDLGAPLPSDTADATWEGRYYLFLNQATHDITFTIDFEEGEIDGTDTQTTYTTNFDLDFTATGVITGDIILESVFEDDIAEARGLIGAEGLVGGFANTDGGSWASNLYGGFVADNPAFDNPAVVEYNDWLAIGETVATPSSPVKNEFISGITTTGIRDGDGMQTHLNFGHLTLSNAKYKGVAFGGDDNDGFSPVYGDGANVYVGILPTTNLGAPLTQTTASAVWQAVLWANHKRISENGSFTPTIDFTAKTMTGTIADRAMDDTDFAVVAGNTFPTGVAYSFTASFDNPRGQLTGTITRTSTIDSAEVVSAGVVRGIIGEEGAVAGFISNGTSTDLSYTGGFVARPTQ